MRFWDSSALVPLLVAEDRSDEARQWLRDDPAVLAYGLTPVEIASALWRRRHAGELSPAAHDEAERTFADLEQRWIEIEFSRDVADRARTILSRHPLRAMDALQLAAASFAAGDARSLTFVTFDKRLASAARAEGFPVLF